jgi:hypothetical protein
LSLLFAKWIAFGASGGVTIGVILGRITSFFSNIEFFEGTLHGNNKPIIRPSRNIFIRKFFI